MAQVRYIAVANDDVKTSRTHPFKVITKKHKHEVCLCRMAGTADELCRMLNLAELVRAQAWSKVKE